MITKEEFIRAAEYGDSRIIKQYIEEGGDIEIKNRRGHTALMLASQYNRLEVVKYLIGAGADINVRDNHNWNALMHALRYDHTEVVKVLENPNEYLLRKKLDIENASDVIKDSCIF